MRGRVKRKVPSFDRAHPPSAGGDSGDQSKSPSLKLLHHVEQHIALATQRQLHDPVQQRALGEHRSLI
jgi:hypothetical protein